MKHPSTWLIAILCLALGYLLGQSPTSQPLEPQAKAQPASTPTRTVPADDGKLRIICFGAHPDDCELDAGGTAAKWAEKGHHVKFVSVTNGDIGHWRQAGGPLARRRNDEVQRAAKTLGITTEVLDIHDGELMPSLENRKTITRLIREWKPDIVMAHRPNDYHPDHRYTGQLVQDSAYMGAVPFICPDTKPLKRNPVYLYFHDNFKKPTPFEGDIVVSIDDVIEKKLDALMFMDSQFYEGGALGSAKLMPSDPKEQAQRRRKVRASLGNRNRRIAEQHRKGLAAWYGEEQAKNIAHAEVFEICEYGRQPTKKELAELFPFFGK